MTHEARDEYRALLRDLRAQYGERIMRALADRHAHDLDGFGRAARAALGIAVEQDVRAHRDRDELTILTGTGRATKLITAARISEYAAGTWFGVTTAEVAGIAELAGRLADLERQPYSFIIRGRLIAGRDPARARRLLYPNAKLGEPAYFEPRPRRWCGLDFDSFDLPDGVDPVDLEAVGALALARLPEPFRRVSRWAQLTSGAGIKPGGRIRLWFWLDRPTSGAELKRWLRDVPGLDTSTLNDVTPNYVAKPLFVGVPDPVPLRSKLIPGEGDAVNVPDLPERGRQASPHSWPLRPHHGAAPARAEAYAAACLRQLALAPEGRRHPTCLAVSCRLLALAKGGALDPRRVTAQIKGVMLGKGFDGRNGRDLSEIDRILEWAWTTVQPEDLSDVRK